MGGAAAWRRTAETVWLWRAMPLFPSVASSVDGVAAALRAGSSYVSGPAGTLALGRRVREGKAAKAEASAKPIGARNGMVMANLLATKRDR